MHSCLIDVIERKRSEKHSSKIITISDKTFIIEMIEKHYCIKTFMQLVAYKRRGEKIRKLSTVTDINAKDCKLL